MEESPRSVFATGLWPRLAYMDVGKFCESSTAFARRRRADTNNVGSDWCLKILEFYR